MTQVEPGRRRWQALAMLCAANFMVILDGTIVFVAMPSIGRELALTTGTAQWVMTAYGLVFGGLLLLCGRAADLLGRRRLFMVGSLIFVIASLLCGLAWAPWVLIAARALQGLSAAIMSPAALSLVMTTFTKPAERNKALAIWGAVGGLGGTAASLVGGPLTDLFGWEWIFFINVPIGIALVALSPVLVAESRDESSRRTVDVAGAVTITVALGLAVYAIVKGPEAGWASGQTLGLLAGAIALIAVFVVIESRTLTPMIPLRVFRSRSLLAGNLTLLTIGICAYGMVFTLTAYAQGVLNYSAVQFGLMTAVMAGTAAASSFIAEAVANRRGPRPIAIVSLVFVGVGLVLLSMVSADGSYWNDIFWGLLIFGPGLGAGFVAGTIASFGGVEERDAGLAAGLINTSWQIGGSLGIAILTSVSLARSAGFAAESGQQPNTPAALTEGFQSAFLVAVIFAVVGLVVVTLLLRKPRQTTLDASVTAPAAASD
ncbi:MFS transporter [Amycolatopsis sp. cmx-11-12]|uniref:MFS transporter n=1 Tax=Amycolatopsis sp. cmx-11-12 TaxID=2785795 RepID=UPI003917C4E2